MSGKSSARIFGIAGFFIALDVCATPLSAQSIEEKTQVCAGCHGQNGKPVDKAIPVIWGQQQGYLYIQLRDFKRGDRKNEIMQPIHERMPVILPLGREKNWLPPNPSGMYIFPPFPSELMTTYPVSPKMNKASFNEPAAIAPLEPVVD